MRAINPPVALRSKPFPAEPEVLVLVPGLGGAVATTAAAGAALLAWGVEDARFGLPLAEIERADLPGYGGLAFDGWDLFPDDLAAQARAHRVLDPARLASVAPALARLRPRPAAADARFCPRLDGAHRIAGGGKREILEQLAADIADARAARPDAQAVMIHCASTESAGDPGAACYDSLDALERGLDGDDPAIGPAALYAYAAIEAGVPYANFTPSVAVDAPALAQLARRRGVPVAGKDGKTGQTLLKSVLAPAFRARALRVAGWASTNLLGNRDGEVLDHPGALAAKARTKAGGLEAMLGYPVEHLVDVRFYSPRGDDKEAWDAVDLIGFLGGRMQLKLNLLARDSILAAPLVIELARLLALAHARGEAGPLPALSGFFKAPMPDAKGRVVHGFAEQETLLHAWLAQD